MRIKLFCKIKISFFHLRIRSNHLFDILHNLGKVGRCHHFKEYTLFNFDCFITWHLGHRCEEKFYLHRKSFLIPKNNRLISCIRKIKTCKDTYQNHQKDRQQHRFRNNEINLSKKRRANYLTLSIYVNVAATTISYIFS